jgi:hypothetical protein
MQRHKRQDKILNEEPMIRKMLGVVKQINEKEKTCI